MKIITVNSLCLVLAFGALACQGPLAVAQDTGARAVAPGAKQTGEGSMPISKKWTLEQLLALNGEQILALWKALPPASLEELNGHYMGLVPNAGDKVQQLRTADYMYNEDSVRGYWLGKAYRKTGDNKGEGYNRWRFPGGRIVRNLRFATEVGPSLIDGKPSFLMYYGAYNRGNTLIDELRKLDDYIYLGVGTQQAPNGGRTAPGHFILTGPTDEWVGVENASAAK